MNTPSSRKSRPAIDRLDYGFHHAIVEASGHKRLLRAYEGAHIRVLSTRAALSHPADQQRGKLAAEHRDILEQIAKGNASLAERVARQHVEGSIRLLEQAIGVTLEQVVRGSPGLEARRSRKKRLKSKETAQ